MYVYIFEINKCEPKYTDIHPGITTLKMRQQPGNSEHKTLYLPKAAQFRKHGANSCTT